MKAFLRSKEVWLIWSNEHQMWWRANAHGYTIEIAEAGRYCLKDAEFYCLDHRCPKVPLEVICPSPELIAKLNTI